MPISFKIEKLKIIAYSDSKRKSKEGEVEVVLKNESFNRIYNNQFKKFRGINTSGRKANFAFSNSSQLKLSLLFDNTGIFEEHKEDVDDLIDKFMSLCFYVAGKIHEPRYLNIQWGKQNFDCRLQTVDIKYTMFDSSGIPLRADLETVFIEDIDDEKRKQLDNLSSPDLTHMKMVKAGDTLPMMTKDVYGDPKYYIHVAKVNKLDNFRQLQVGQQLFFPPLKK